MLERLGFEVVELSVRLVRHDGLDEGPPFVQDGVPAFPVVLGKPTEKERSDMTVLFERGIGIPVPRRVKPHVERMLGCAG
jgi:hypothetical protein